MNRIRVIYMEQEELIFHAIDKLFELASLDHSKHFYPRGKFFLRYSTEFYSSDITCHLLYISLTWFKTKK